MIKPYFPKMKCSNNEFIPLKTKVVKHAEKPWFSLDIQKSIQKRNEAYHNWKNFKTQKFYDFFKLCRKEVNVLI